MALIKTFTFNLFSENCYVLFDETKECAIIDPGCYMQHEKDKLRDFIKAKGLKPTLFLNTHCHLDHVFGNRFVSKEYDLPLVMHKLDVPVYKAVENYAGGMGFSVETLPEPGKFIEEGDTVSFGNTTLDVLFTPGHSPGSVCFLSKKDDFVIAGDVLFHQSIGRTDLPGGDFDTLINSIKTRLFTLPNNTEVYPGHGPSTTVGFEKKNNPFLK